jgi:hypothetical protein
VEARAKATPSAARPLLAFVPLRLFRLKPLSSSPAFLPWGSRELADLTIIFIVLS